MQPGIFHYRKEETQLNIVEFTGLLEGVTDSASGFSARCPAHDDAHASLSIAEGRDGKILLNCHAGCTPEQIVSAMGLTMSDLFPPEDRSLPSAVKVRSERAKDAVEAEYVYYDEDCTPILRKTKVRKKDGSKYFYWQHFNGCSWQKGKAGLMTPLYRGETLKDSEYVLIAEGEKDVDTLIRLGYTAVSLPDGADSRWLDEYGRQLTGRNVYIFPDNDEPGRKYASMIAGKLYGKAEELKILDLSEFWPEMPAKADISDMVETLGEDAAASAVNELVRYGPDYSPAAESAARFRALPANGFESEKTRFVWHPYIPIGDYTVLMAEGGTGKTFLCCKIAADISKGRRLPGDESFNEPAPANVLIISAEDRGSLLKERLIGADADLSRVYILDCKGSEGLNFDTGLESFRELLKCRRPRLVIVDPWHAFLGKDLNINLVNALRPVLQKLANLAKECDCGMILVSHVNKRSQSDNANNAATGSTDFINAARSAIRVIFDDTPGKKDYRIAVHTKSNYARSGRSIAYCLTDGGTIEWAGFSEIDRSILEEAARCRKTPSQLIAGKEAALESREALIEAIKKLASGYEGKPINVSYEQMMDDYGPDIFGSCQPKKALTGIRIELLAEGIRLTLGKHVRYDGASKQGFAIVVEEESKFNIEE